MTRSIDIGQGGIVLTTRRSEAETALDKLFTKYARPGTGRALTAGPVRRLINPRRGTVGHGFRYAVDWRLS